MYEDLWISNNNTNADIVIGKSYYEYNNDVTKIVENLPTKEMSTEEIKRYTLLNGCRMVTNIIKRKLITDNDLFYPEGLSYEDNANGPCLLLCANSFSFCDIPGYYYRINMQSTTHRLDMRFFDRLITANIFYENINKLNLNEKYKDEIVFAYYKLYIYFSIIGSLNTSFERYPLSKIQELINNLKIPKAIIIKNKYYKNTHTLRKFIVRSIWTFPHLGILISIINRLKKSLQRKNQQS